MHQVRPRRHPGRERPLKECTHSCTPRACAHANGRASALATCLRLAIGIRSAGMERGALVACSRSYIGIRAATLVASGDISIPAMVRAPGTRPGARPTMTSGDALRRPPLASPPRASPAPPAFAALALARRCGSSSPPVGSALPSTPLSSASPASGVSSTRRAPHVVDARRDSFAARVLARRPLEPCMPALVLVGSTPPTTLISLVSLASGASSTQRADVPCTLPTGAYSMPCGACQPCGSFCACAHCASAGHNHTLAASNRPTTCARTAANAHAPPPAISAASALRRLPPLPCSLAR